MYQQLHHTLSLFSEDKQSNLLTSSNIGLEKECLRVDRNGMLSQSPHPISLGSTLTNPYITTDYSEALLEFITPPEKSAHEAIQFLQKIHQFVYSELKDEYLWGASMPCVVSGGEGIPIAQYGSSNRGIMKTVYRRGLGYRYGRMMQAIAGIHFNFSMQEDFWSYYQDVQDQKSRPLKDFISEQYFCLIRNLQRYGWLVFYLFGTSPAICKSFLSGQPTKLEKFDNETYYLPYATTLRMGDIGYNNKKENEMGVKACYDDLSSYIKCLSKAINTPHPGFEKIGIKVAGEYRQLNANILQIENEYYSTIRPKQPLVNNEKPVHALGSRGVQYIELRSLDLNLFDPLGISKEQLYFLEAFMLFCLLHESRLIDQAERDSIDDNGIKVAHQGRDPLLKLTRRGKRVSPKNWGLELLSEMQAICAHLDEQKKTTMYSEVLQQQLAVLGDAELTPSAKVLHGMRENKECFFEFANRISKKHEILLRNNTLCEKDMDFFQNIARKSVEKQRQIEESDAISFDQFLQNYLSSSLSEREVMV